MTHKQRVLELLSDGEPHTHLDLYRLGCIAHSRVSDLRRDGHQIECWRDGDLSYYRLVSLVQPEVFPSSTVAAFDDSPASGCASDGELSLFQIPPTRERYAA